MVSLSPSSTPSVLGYQGSGDGAEALSSIPSITTPGVELGQKWGCWWLWHCTMGSIPNCQGTIKPCLTRISAPKVSCERPCRGEAGGGEMVQG